MNAPTLNPVALIAGPTNLHMVVEHNEKTGRYLYVCEANPLMTIQTFEVPKKCPVCACSMPVGGQTLVGKDWNNA